MREKQSNFFRGKVLTDARNQKTTSSGYLKLPKGIKMYNAESEIRKVKLDFLPYIVTDSNHPNRNVENNIAVVGNQWFYRPFKIHRDIGSDRKTSTVVCPTSIGKKCPVCEYQKKLFDQGAPKTETVPLYPKPRALYIVVPLDQKDFDEVPHIWDMSKKMFHDVLQEILEEDESNEVFPSLTEGKTLEISFKWDSIGEKGKPFPETRNITFTNREPYDEKILDEVPNLDEVLNVLSYDELFNKFNDLDNVEDGGKLKDVDDTTEVEKTERTRKSIRSEKEEEKPTRRGIRETKKEEPTPPTWAELQNIDRANLVTMVDGYELKIQIDDFEDSDAGDDELRKAIAEEMNIEIPSKRSVRAERTPVKATRGSEDDIKPQRGSYSSDAGRQSEKKDESEVKKSGMSRSSRSSEKAEQSEGKDKCPHGHKYGIETERFDDCDTCKIFDPCLEAKKSK